VNLKNNKYAKVYRKCGVLGLHMSSIDYGMWRELYHAWLCNDVCWRG